MDARKCATCDSYLDWRRYLQFSTVVLSLLVALLSVASLTLPKIVEIFRPLRSGLVVNVGPVACPSMPLSEYWRRFGHGPLPDPREDSTRHFLRLSIVITNSGNAAGTVMAVSCKGLIPAKPDTEIGLSAYSRDVHPVQTPIVIAPKSTSALDAYYEMDGPTKVPEGKFELILDVIDSNGEEHVKRCKATAVAMK